MDTTALLSATPNQTLEESRLELRSRAQHNPYFFQKAGLGYKDVTTELHQKVCDFIGNRDMLRKGLQMSRGHLKTSCAQIGDILWDVCNFLSGAHPIQDEHEFPILVAMSTATNAKLKSIKLGEDWDKAVVAHWLFPEVEKGDIFSQDKKTFIVRGDDGKPLRQVSIEYIGVGGRASSRHFRKLILDDLHAVETAQDSPPEIAEVIRWYSNTDSLLIEPAKDWINLIGTCASLVPQDVYLYAKEREKDAIKWLTIPCYYGDLYPGAPGKEGTPVWPERFPKHVLESIRKKQGDVLFALNYLLDYVDPSVVEFKSSDFKRFRPIGPDLRTYLLDNGKRYKHEDLFVEMTVDLAGWRGTGDKNAIQVCGTASDDMHLILDSWKRRCDPDTLIKEIIERHKTYQIPFVGVEEVAYQECLSFYLDKAIREQGLYLTVKPVKPRGINKDVRIRTMQPLQRAGLIAVNENDVLFLEELTKFPRGEKHLLDCYAYHPQVWSTPSSERMEDRETEQLQDYLRAVGGVA